MAERVSTIRNAVDGTMFSPAARATRSDEWGFATAPVVAFVGRLSPEKNPLLFVHVAARVRQAMLQARFVVVGDGPLREPMEAAARALCIDDAIRFAGIRGDMPHVYRQIDVLLLTSWHEGTPLAVLEAMASGVPVVASDTGGVRELVAVDRTGRLFAPGDEAAAADHTVAILADGALHDRYATAARDRVLERFPWPAHVAAVTALWREIAASSRPRGLFACLPHDGAGDERTPSARAGG